MATLPLKVSHKERRSVIHFLRAKGLTTNAIHSEMHPVYGDSIVLLDQQNVWCKKFAQESRKCG